jgi:hypothetical protein
VRERLRSHDNNTIESDYRQKFYMPKTQSLTIILSFATMLRHCKRMENRARYFRLVLMMKSSRPSPNSVPRTKPPGMRDIAEALQISTGTVDRALHNKPGISPLTRQRVLSMANAIDRKSVV